MRLNGMESSRSTCGINCRLTYYGVIFIYRIYNSVVTCRNIVIISSASAPLNAMKIAVKKASDVEVVRFGPENSSV